MRLIHYLIRMRLFLCLLLAFGPPLVVGARLKEQWSYQQMIDKADLVVIARVISTKDTSERGPLPDFDSNLTVVGVITEFECRVVFKGPKDITKFQLRHYRYESEEDKFGANNNPELIQIKLGQHPAFLLFLVKERDGKYVPFGGQTDPAALSVLDLRGAAD